VSDNRTTLTSDIHKLTKVSGVLSGEKEALQEIVDMAPYALSNLALAYDPKARTLDTKDDAQQPLVAPNAQNGVLCQLAPPQLQAFLCSGSATGAKTLADLLAVKP
jgi:phospholipid/cholesterol/gamma-HCH transport system substrate-binding protein